jgi:hypothetical protein
VGVSLGDCELRSNTRVGVSSFGSTVKLRHSMLECNPIHLDGAQAFDMLAQPLSVPFAFEDQGGNACGCDGTAVQCTVLSAGLDPPRPVD